MRRVGAPLAALLTLAVVAAVGPTGMGRAQASASGGGREAAVSAFLQEKWGDDGTGEGAKASKATGSWRAKADLGSLYNVTDASGAQAVWDLNGPAKTKVTGLGVTVALIDTGVSPVPGLDGAGKVINGPDLSFDGQSSSLRYLDAYGHGTHMAGIIAGRDEDVKSGKENDPKRFVGVAPDAQLLNMKVATADGGVDVTQVIAAIDWVVRHRTDNGMNVRVINLSYGTSSSQSYLADPLAKAVENAWKAGIVVVVAAGNDGGTAPLNMPAADPYVIGVGASDHQGTATRTDDKVTAFTNPGTADRRPDLLAPGKSVVSLRVPGSVVDQEHPEGLVTGDKSGRFFRGSGTSQAAAVVSGAVALLLQARPALTPDQVKRTLQLSADSMPAEPSEARGAGQLNIESAVALTVPSADSSRQSFATSNGLGSLDASRGDTRVVDPATGVALTGQVDAVGSSWDPTSWSAASTAGTAWDGGQWNGSRWSGDSWQDGSWAGSRWSGTNWSGIDWLSYSWDADAWSGSRWSGSRWSDADWSGSRWSGSRWSGSRWSGSRWSDSDWSGSRWSDSDWSGSRWSGSRWS
jgi:serine protease AprX